MPEDPLPSLGPDEASSGGADYEATYAAVTESARGRWFLEEFARRNRRADTNLVLAALARVEAVLRGGPAPRLAAADLAALSDIGAALERIAAAVTTEAAAAPDVANAAERIQDLAFGLREHTLEDSMCDALDAAAREICAACAQHERIGESARRAGAQLRELAARIDALIAGSHAGADAPDKAASSRGGDAVGEALAVSSVRPREDVGAVFGASGAAPVGEADPLPRQDLFTTDRLASPGFVDAVAALAASLPPDSAEADGEPPRDPVGSSAVPANAPASENPPAIEQPRPPSHEPLDDGSLAAAAGGGDDREAAAESAERRLSRPIEAPDRAEPGAAVPCASAPQPGRTGSSQSQQALPKPLPPPASGKTTELSAPPQARENEVETGVVAGAPAAETLAPALPSAATDALPPLLTLQRSAPADPLAPIRALSEDELIALFS